MERFVQAGSLSPLSVRSLAGFSVAGLGVGCYRMGINQADVLLHTLRQGSVNVIDTSSTYVAGDSERMIGQVLSTPELRDRRGELVVVSKLGYLQGPLLAEAAEREAAGRLWPEVQPCPCTWCDQQLLSHLRAARAHLLHRAPADAHHFHMHGRPFCSRLQNFTRRRGIASTRTSYAISLRHPESVCSAARTWCCCTTPSFS